MEDELLLLAVLMELTLPSHTVRLCDGGFVDWPARGTFTAEDPVFGTIESAEGIAESISDEAPNWGMTLLPPDLAAAGDLFQTDAQGSPVSFWIAVVDRQTGLIVGDPELIADGQLDTITVSVGKGARKVDMQFVASAERLFMVMEGVSLTPRWHKSFWPGEKGLDHASGIPIAVPWGVPDPSRGTIYDGVWGSQLPTRPVN